MLKSAENHGVADEGDPGVEALRRRIAELEAECATLRAGAQARAGDEALRASETRARLAIESAALGTWDLDLTTPSSPASHR